MSFECKILRLLGGEEEVKDVLYKAVVKEAELRRMLKGIEPEETAVRRLVIWQLYGEEAETAFLFLINKAGTRVEVKPLCIGGVRQRESYVQYAKQQLLQWGTGYFCIAHNHETEDLTPSIHDLVLTEAMEDMAEELPKGQITFLGHYITNGFKIEKVRL